MLSGMHAEAVGIVHPAFVFFSFFFGLFDIIKLSQVKSRSGLGSQKDCEMYFWFCKNFHSITLSLKSFQLEKLQ